MEVVGSTDGLSQLYLTLREDESVQELSIHSKDTGTDETHCGCGFAQFHARFAQVYTLE